jgi:hypothetical protein
VVRVAELVDLQRVSGVGVRTTVHALPAAVQVVEAVVLLVDHHDVVDLRQLIVARRTGGAGAEDHGEPDGGGEGQPAAAAASPRNVFHVLASSLDPVRPTITRLRP